MRTFLNEYRAAHEAGDRWTVGRVIDLWAVPGTFQAMSVEAREVAAAGTALNICQWQSHFQLQLALDAFRTCQPRRRSSSPNTAIGSHARSVKAFVG